MTKIMMLAVVLAMVGGCATIIDGNDQSVVVSTVNCEQHGNPICIAQNKDNAAKVRTPGTIPIEKGSQDLIVTCKSDNGLASGIYSAASTYKAMNLGNILIGGLIGFGVDAATGAMWEFPTNIVVEMICDE